MLGLEGINDPQQCLEVRNNYACFRVVVKGWIMAAYLAQTSYMHFIIYGVDYINRERMRLLIEEKKSCVWWDSYIIARAG